MEARGTKRTDLFLIDPRNIVVVSGFNVRIDFDLEELKEQIKDKGVMNPITVIPFRDKNGAEKYKLVDGERRYRATMQAIEEGSDIKYIKALKAPRDSNLESLYIEQMMRNEGKRFTEYECAIMYKRFRDEFGYSQAEIASKFHKSPAAICKCLSLLELPDYIQRKVATGAMSVMAAKEIISNYDTEAEQVEAAKAVVQKAREKGKKSVTSKLVNETILTAKEAKTVSTALKTLLCYLGSGVKVDVAMLSNCLDSTRDIEQALTLYKQL